MQQNCNWYKLLGDPSFVNEKKVWKKQVETGSDFDTKKLIIYLQSVLE